MQNESNPFLIHANAYVPRTPPGRLDDSEPEKYLTR